MEVADTYHAVEYPLRNVISKLVILALLGDV